MSTEIVHILINLFNSNRFVFMTEAKVQELLLETC